MKSNIRFFGQEDLYVEVAAECVRFYKEFYGFTIAVVKLTAEQMYKIDDFFFKNGDNVNINSAFVDGVLMGIEVVF